MLSKIRRILFGDSTEHNLVIIVCVLALVGITVSSVVDWGITQSVTVLLRNIIFALLFAILFALSMTNRDKEWIKVVFGFVLIILMTLFFLESKALQDMGKFYALGSLIILTIIYNSYWMFIMPAIYITIIMLLINFPESFLYDLIPSIDAMNDVRGDLSFWSNTLGILLIILYLKEQYDKNQSNLLEINNNLEASNQKMAEQNAELVNNRKELETANASLNENIEKRTKELKKRNVAVRAYIEMNTKEILNPLKETINEIEGVNLPESRSEEDEKLMRLLRESGEELDKIYETIKDNLMKDGKISREDLL